MKFILLLLILLCNIRSQENRLDTFNYSEIIINDYKNFYSYETLEESSPWILVGAFLANTKIDTNFDNWYQSHIRSENTNDFSETCKIFGEGEKVLPYFIGSISLGYLLNKFHISEGDIFYDWGEKSMRTVLIGTPILLSSKLMLGSGRPEESSSQWNPFDNDNGVSGHAFIGAIPFLTAAHMVDDKLIKASLYLSSTLCAWSRVNDNDHYLSQALLGWSIAYISSLQVFDKKSPIKISPIMFDKNLYGISLIYNF